MVLHARIPFLAATTEKEEQSRLPSREGSICSEGCNLSRLDLVHIGGRWRR